MKSDDDHEGNDGDEEGHEDGSASIKVHESNEVKCLVRRVITEGSQWRPWKAVDVTEDLFSLSFSGQVRLATDVC